MNVQSINIEHVTKHKFSSNLCDGLCHTKVLPYLSVVQAVEGSYDIQLDNNKTYNTGDGGFFIAPSNVHQRITHNVDRLSKNMVCRWVFIKIKINGFYSFDDKYSFPTILPQHAKAEMNEIFDRLFNVNNAFDEYVCYYQIIRLLSRVAYEKEQPLPLYIENALIYIKQHYKERFLLEDIAREIHLSPSYLFAVFKRQMGVSPICFLNNYRLSLAADLLQGSTKSIKEIASEVGIQDSVYFNKMFKKHYQMSPTEYRSYITKAE